MTPEQARMRYRVDLIYTFELNAESADEAEAEVLALGRDMEGHMETASQRIVHVEIGEASVSA